MFHDIEYILEVYRQRSFSKAAKALYISQPSLSHTIKRTESMLGGDIFDRSYKPLILTELGKKYIASAMEIQNIKNQFQQYLQDTSEEVIGNLSVGGTTTFTSFVLPRVISSYACKYPRVKLQITEASSSILEDKLMNGALDIVIDNGNLNEEFFTCIPFEKEEILLAVPKTLDTHNPYKTEQEKTRKQTAVVIEKLPTIPLSVFSDQPFILLKEGNDTRKRSDLICNEAGFTPKILFELEQQIAAYNMSVSGLGISFVGELLVRESQRPDKLNYYRIDNNLAQRNISIFYKKNRHLSKAANAFINILVPNYEP